MKRNFLVALLFVFSSYSYSQKLVSMEDFEDNKDSYVGKNIKILIGNLIKIEYMDLM